MSPKKRRAAQSNAPRKRRAGSNPEGDASVLPVGLRIIGGEFRGRRLEYGGDVRVRPMKDRVREAVFNLLGPAVRGKHAIDLFAGTGALGLEAISRGAVSATLIEQHYPTAAVIRRNIAALGVEGAVDLQVANVFLWSRGQLPPTATPWVVFASPPYDFFVDRAEEMLALVGRLIEAAGAESLIAVEADERFDFGRLPDADAWDVRTYRPAVVGVYCKPASLAGTGV